jgi:hypothetical protein
MGVAGQPGAVEPFALSATMRAVDPDTITPELEMTGDPRTTAPIATPLVQPAGLILLCAATAGL